MPDKKGSKIVKAIQELHLRLETEFDEKIPAIFDELADKVSEIINDSDIDFASRNPVVRVQSIKKVQRLKVDFADALIALPEYKESVNALTVGMEGLKALTDSYFSNLIDNFDDKPALYTEILKANIESTQTKLLGAGIRDNFAESINEVLRANIAGKSKRSDLNKAVREAIVGTPEKPLTFLKRYVKQTANDAIQVFNAEYIETISTDLNLEFYFYQGTLIEDSRPFCKARAGRYFTKKEIQDWAKLKGWDGRMPNTTATTIFVYRGGYGCIHLILPVTEAEYQKQSEKGNSGIK